MTDSSETKSTRSIAIAALIEDVRIAKVEGRFVDNQTIIDAHMDLMPELAVELEKLERVERARRSAEAPTAGNANDEDMSLASAYLNEIQTPATQVPGYSILRELSRGGQAVVYLAMQLSTGRKVALKLMHDGLFASERALTRFRREVQSLAALNHPNIVAIIDTGRTRDGGRFIAMNYISGMNLSDYMQDRQKKDPADPGKLLRLFLKICDAVDAAHRLGIIHRDLKPSNIRVDERGEPKILDFGLARTALDHALPNLKNAVSVTGEFLGSLPWSSPEQAEGNPEKIDIRTDVYSLGVILYQMLTGGRFPYDVVGNIRDVLNNILTVAPIPPSKVAKLLQPAKPAEPKQKQTLPAVNEAIERIVLKALSKKPESRYASAGDLGKDVARYLAGLRTAAREQERRVPAPPTSPKSRMKYVLPVAGIAMIVTLLIGWVVYEHSYFPVFGNRVPTVAPQPTVPGIPTHDVESSIANTPHATPEKEASSPAVPSHTAPQSIPSPIASTHGNLAILFKGGTLEVFINGKRIHQSAGEDLRVIPTTLSAGDCIVLRLNSSFYYRSIRCVFVADDRSASFVEKAADSLIRPSPDPKTPAPSRPFDAPFASPGPHDDRQLTVWNDAGLPSNAEWIGLPEANTIYEIAFTVR